MWPTSIFTHSVSCIMVPTCKFIVHVPFNIKGSENGHLMFAFLTLNARGCNEDALTQPQNMGQVYTAEPLFTQKVQTRNYCNPRG